MTHRRLIPAACALALLLTAMPAHAATFWNEGFEFADNAAWLANGTGWGPSACTPAGHNNILEISSERAFLGTKSLKYTFVGFLPANVANVTCYIDRFYPLSSEVYTRRYVFLSGFTSQSPGTKLVFLGETAYVNFWEFFEGTNNVLKMNAQGSALGGNGQIWSFGPVPSARWVCIETHIKYNTSGVSDGVLEGWMDGVQRFSRSDMFFNAANQTGRFRQLRLYRQHGTGVMYVDELAIGNTRIGCLGAQTDRTPPSTPSNFVVN